MYLDRAQEDKASHAPGCRVGEPRRCIDVDAAQSHLVCGAMGNRSEVHHGVGTLEKRAPVEFPGDIRDLDLLCFERYRAAPICVPNDGTHGVSAREQLATKRCADESGCSGDNDAHDGRMRSEAPSALRAILARVCLCADFWPL
jgi:hypothetical protein